MRFGGLRGFAAAVISALLVMSVASPVSAKEAWRANSPSFFDPNFGSFQVDYNNGRDIISLEEEAERTYSGAYFRTMEGKWSVCNDIGADLNCGITSSGYVTAQILLPLCTDVIENCVEGIEVGGETLSPATYVGSGVGFPFVGNPARGVPNGGSPHFFDSDTPHTAGNRYAVAAILHFGANVSVGYDNFSVRVWPVKESPNSRNLPRISICKPPVAGLEEWPCMDNADECIYQRPGVCAIAQDFAPGTKVAVKLRISNAVSGWFRGRLKAPEIEVKPLDSAHSSVRVAGEPVEVPRLVTTYVEGVDGPNVVGNPAEVPHGGSFTIFNAATARGIQVVNDLRKKTKDTATAVSTLWMINSINSGSASGGSGGSCLADTSRLLGVVTTNAMAYTGTVPDYKDGYLSYRVAGMHFLPDGKTEALGTYDLVMRSDVARCLYGFSKAPVSATITVVGAAGEEKVATTVVSERDGWLKLAAYGFTFSEKEVRVTITQEKEPEPVIVAAPVAKPKSLTTAKLGTKLTAAQKTQIRKFATTSGNKNFTCTGYYRLAKDRAAALKRAQLSCAEAKAAVRGSVVASKVSITKLAAQDGRVLIGSK